MNETFPFSFSVVHYWKYLKRQLVLGVGYEDCGTFTGGQNPTYFNLQNSRQGSDNPGWRSAVARGSDATTAFSGTRYRRTAFSNGFVEITHKLPTSIGDCKFHKVSRTGNWLAFSNPSNSLGPADIALDQAKRLFTKRAKSVITPFQGGTFLGELRQTLHMIRHPASSLRSGIGSYFEKLKKVSPRLSSAKRKRILNDTYLEATFGWQPLVADIQNGLEALKRLRESRPFEIIRIPACYGTSEGATDVHRPGSAGANTIFQTLKIDDFLRTEGRTSCRISGGVRVESAASSAGWLDVTGLSFENFAPTAWELLPYSFVVDYFSNIGNIIDAWSLIDNHLAWSCLVTRRVETMYSYGTSIDIAYANSIQPSQPVISSTCSPCQFGLQKITVTRSSLGSLVPSLRFRLPGFGSVQSLNVATLLLQKQPRRPFY